MKKNEFIAVLSEGSNGEVGIECNTIESNGQQTLIYGIVEGSIHGYDILIATIPSSRPVYLRINNPKNLKP